MNRSKIILIAVLVVLVAAIAVIGSNVNGKNVRAKKVRKARDAAKVELEKVFKDDIFPSAENVVALRDNSGKLEVARDEIAARLAECNFNAPTNISPSVFVDRLRAVVLMKREKAPVVEGKKSVGPEFMFGFERYLGASAVMPRDTDVPRLLEQLVITSALVDEIYASGVTTVKAIRREMFDGAGETAVAEEESSAGRRGRRRNRGGDDEAAVSAQPAAGPGYSIDTDLYRAQHFTLQLVARQNAVVDLLNRIAKLHTGSKGLFAIVSDIRLQKSGADLRLPGGGAPKDDKEVKSGRRGSRSAEEETEEPAAEVDGPVISKLPPGQRLMSGPELDAPLDVVIDLDVYSFNTREAE